MAYTFSVYNSIAQITDSYSEKGKMPICKGIETVQAANIENVKNYYVLTFEDDALICVSYFQLLSVTPIHFNISDKKIQQAALSLALRIVKPTLLVVGNLFRHDAAFQQFIEANISPEKKAAIFMATTDHMIAHTNASGIFLKDVPNDIAPFIQQDASYLQMPDDVSMEMKIPSEWTNFADYEAALKHKYLQRCRKVRKSFADIRITELSTQEIKKHSKDLEQLYLQVTNKQMVSMGILNDEFFIQLKEKLGENYKVFGYFQGDKMVAFASAIIHHEEYDMNYIGMDYSYNQSHHLYFNILFHCLESALHYRCKKLILGRTAPEAKAILGCYPDYRFSFYKLRNVIVNWFYKMVAAYFQEQQGESWKDRHPFKSSYYAHPENQEINSPNELKQE